MNIYSGKCLLCECGLNTNFKDITGKDLFTGDIVIDYTVNKEGLLESTADNLTAVVMNKYTTYSDGKIELRDKNAEPFIMGIAGCEPVFVGPETQFKSEHNIWVVKKIKDFRDVIDGENGQHGGLIIKMNNLDAIEQKMRMYNLAHGRCYYCDKRLPFAECQLAHRIPKHKKYLCKYGPEIIHHPLNMRITCDRCNSSALLDPATHPIEVAELIEQIKERLQ